MGRLGYIELWNESLKNSNKEGGSGHVPGCGFQVVFDFDVRLSEMLRKRKKGEGGVERDGGRGGGRGGEGWKEGKGDIHCKHLRIGWLEGLGTRT